MTSDEIIKSAVRRAGIPKSQATFTDDDFLAFANEEMDTGLVPSVLISHEDYFLTSDDIPVNPNLDRYEIPGRATGNKLRDLSYIDNNGNVYEMVRIPIDNVSDYNTAYNYTNRGYTYYVQNNQVILTPQSTPLSPGFFRFSYYIRPNRLVLLKDVGVITNINLLTGEISISSNPQYFSVQQKFDFVSVTSPHRTLSKDLTAVAYNTTTKVITFAITDIPSTLNIGDHVCVAETAAIPQFPSDLHVILAHRVAARCLESLGDQEGLQAANVKLAELEQKTQTIIDNRVEASPEKIIPRHGVLRRRRNFRRG
jgi:hypothetical protein